MFRGRVETQKGFSLLEVVAVLSLAGILAAVAITRDKSDPARAITERDILAAHLRSAQMLSMKSGGIQSSPSGNVGQVYGLTCDGNTAYWVFSGTDPNVANTVVRVVDDPSNMDASGKLLLASKRINLAAFTIFFTGKGIPCSAYTSESNYTALNADTVLTVTDPGQGVNQTLTVTQGTGFIP